MIRGKSHHRWPDPLLLLVVTVILCAVMSTATIAGESFNFFPKPETVYQLPAKYNGFTVASVGHEGGGLGISLAPPSKFPKDFLDGWGAMQKQVMLSYVVLYVRYPW